MNGATPVSHPRDGNFVQGNVSQHPPPGHPAYPGQTPTGMALPPQMQPGAVQRQPSSNMVKWQNAPTDIPHRRELINNM